MPSGPTPRQPDSDPRDSSASSRVPRLSPRAWRRFLFSLLALAAIAAVAVIAHSLLQPRLSRPPTDFLPATAILAIGADLRPDSPAIHHLRRTWPQSDVDHLAGRATDLAQELVYWSGLQLDLRDEASPWFGGELVLAALDSADPQPAGTPTFVIIARATNLRQARGSLHRAVQPIAREGDWRRSVLRSRGRSVTLWTKPDQAPAISYATQDGCLIVGSDDTAVTRCLDAAADPAQRLTASPEFAPALEDRPPESLVWCLGRLPHLRRQLQDALPHLSGGWLGLLEHYRTRTPGPPTIPPHETAAAGLVTAHLLPEKDGARFHCRYSRPGPPPSPAPEPPTALLDLLPAETAAYAIVHDPARWLGGLEGQQPPRPPPSPSQATPPPDAGPLAILNTWLGLPQTPEVIVIALLPGYDPDQGPAVVIAAPKPEAPVAPGLAAAMMPAIRGQIGDAQVVTTDPRALDRCRLAASDPDLRLTPAPAQGALVQVWALPGKLSPSLEHLRELTVEIRHHPAGGEAEIVLNVSPRDLLGRH